MVFNFQLTQQLPLHLLGKSLLISALQLSLGIVEARDSLCLFYTLRILCHTRVRIPSV